LKVHPLGLRLDSGGPPHHIWGRGMGLVRVWRTFNWSQPNSEEEDWGKEAFGNMAIICLFVCLLVLQNVAAKEEEELRSHL